MASQRKPGLNPGRIDVGFVVDIVELGQVYLPVLQLFPVIIIQATLLAGYFIRHRRGIIVAFDSMIKQHTKYLFFVCLFTTVKS
jgi:hypothetical protein